MDGIELRNKLEELGSINRVAKHYECSVTRIRYHMSKHGIASPNKSFKDGFWDDKTPIKKCKKCGEETPGKFESGRRTVCIECRKAWAREHAKTPKAKERKAASDREVKERMCTCGSTYVGRARLLCDECKRLSSPRSNHEIYIQGLLEARGYVVHNNLKYQGYDIDLTLPEERLCIEVNGITHYQPVYGEAKLKRSQELDILRRKAVEELGYTLHVLDISKNTTNPEYYKKKYDSFLDSIGL